MHRFCAWLVQKEKGDCELERPGRVGAPDKQSSLVAVDGGAIAWLLLLVLTG